MIRLSSCNAVATYDAVLETYVVQVTHGSGTRQYTTPESLPVTLTDEEVRELKAIKLTREIGALQDKGEDAAALIAERDALWERK